MKKKRITAAIICVVLAASLLISLVASILYTVYVTDAKTLFPQREERFFFNFNYAAISKILRRKTMTMKIMEIITVSLFISSSRVARLFFE